MIYIYSNICKIRFLSMKKYIGPNLTIIIIIFLFLYPDRAMDVSHNYTGISFTINICIKVNISYIYTSLECCSIGI